MKVIVREIKNLSIQEYLNKFKPYLKDIIIHLQKFNTWKTELTITINFTFFKDTNEERTMYWRSDNIEVMTYDNPDEIIEELFVCSFLDIKLV